MENEACLCAGFSGPIVQQAELELESHILQESIKSLCQVFFWTPECKRPLLALQNLIDKEMVPP